MVTVEFRVGPDGEAHVCEPRMATALCGTNTKGPASDAQRPCSTCLVHAAQRIVELSDGEYIVDSPHLQSVS